MLTVFGGLFAYIVYKMRERTRKAPAAASTSAVELKFFVEYEPPASVEAKTVAAAPAKAPPALSYLIVGGTAFAALLGLGIYYFNTARGVVLRGGWGQGDTAAGAESPAPPSRSRAPRGPELAMPSGTRAPSLFPSPEYDTNHDGILQEDERTAIHAEIPMSILITVDDNGHAQGLLYLQSLFERFDVWGQITFFLTGNYLEGRSSHLGGPIGEWWANLAQDNYVGLHGLGQARGSETWSVDKWSEDTRTLLRAVTTRVTPPEGWTWSTYPWGSRAPRLALSDAYLTALERASPKVFYDSSMIVRPASAVQSDSRDVTWPFTLDTELTPDVQMVGSAGGGGRLALSKHALFEVPLSAWAVRDKGALSWVPSTDDKYFETFPCKATPSAEGLAMFEQNLRAHYRGNRAPFHIGLHPQTFTADRPCERATLEAMMGILQRFAGPAAKVRFEPIPVLVSRLLNLASK